MKRACWIDHLLPYCVLIMVLVLLWASPLSAGASIIENMDSFVPKGKESLLNKIDQVEDISGDHVVATSMCDFAGIAAGSQPQIDSMEWKSKEVLWGETLDEITYTNRFYDIFLISLKGDILYTTARESDFGKNVEDPTLKHQGVHVVYDAIIEGLPSVSYVEPYSPSSGLYSIFLASPVFDSSGKICGVFAIQIAFDTLLTEIYGEEVDFEIQHVELFNREVVDALDLFRVKSNRGTQYFLIGATPSDGRPTGTGYDVGILSGERPESDGDRVCSKWVQFDSSAGEFQGIDISEIYFHVWWKAWDGWAEIGIDPASQYDKEMIPMEQLSLTQAVSEDHFSGFCLSTGKLSLEDDLAELASLTLKIRAMDRVPTVRSGPASTSFIIVNPGPDELLDLRDSDGDGLSDREEMYVTHTDPYAVDTDDDGLFDNQEISSDPNLRDSDMDTIMDPADTEPLTSSFEQITQTKYVTGDEELSGNYLIDDSIVVESGGRLTISESNMFFNGGEKVQRIVVAEGGELVINESTLMLGSALDFFVNTNSWLNWSDWDYIDVKGSLAITNSDIRCASILNVSDADDCTIRGSQFNDMFYAIRLNNTDANIRDVVIDLSVGYGLFLTDCNPVIIGATVTSPTGYSVYCADASPVINDSRFESNVDFVLDRDSHPTLENTTYNASRVETRDQKSSLKLGSNQIQDNITKWTMNTALLCVLVTIGAVFAVIGCRAIWRSLR